MAEIFLAVPRDDPKARPLALKRMLPFLARDEELAAQFEEEARWSSLLAHRAFPLVRTTGREGHVRYLTYDYLPGKDLRALLARLEGKGMSLSVGLSSYLAYRVAEGLDYLHRLEGGGGEPLSLVHHDVSPANVLVGYDGTVRLIDLGIARAGTSGENCEAGGRGKLGYMSPEVMAGKRGDLRADVYSLGVVLHELLTGERLFALRREATASRRQHPVAPPSARRKEVSRGLDLVVLRALEREPEDRFSWASELQDALLPHAEARGEVLLAKLLLEAFPGER
jgi:serine/threonine-protein kinase